MKFCAEIAQTMTKSIERFDKKEKYRLIRWEKSGLTVLFPLLSIL
jgi:hypothetical protein